MFWKKEKRPNSKAAHQHKTEGGDLDEVLRQRELEELGADLSNKVEEKQLPPCTGMIFKSIKENDCIYRRKCASSQSCQRELYKQSLISENEARMFLEQLHEVECMCNDELRNVENMKEMIQPLYEQLNDTTKYRGLQTFVIPSSMSLRNQSDPAVDADQRQQDDDDYAALSGTTIPYVSPLTKGDKQHHHH